jgi:quercetin dioxygenase-like cupin family protein
MQIKRFAEAKAYQAPNHHDVRGLRLQGFENDGPGQFWVGLSHFLPGGSAGPDSSPQEKVYVVLSGTITVKTERAEVTLGPLDSCCVAPNEVREVINQDNAVGTMLVVMPYAKEAT